MIAAVLVLAGGALGLVALHWAREPRRRDEQVRQDALPLTQLLRYDFRAGDKALADVDAVWGKRLALYDDEHREQLRRKLLAFVDFQAAEYADAKEIYLAGRDPRKPSTQALLAQQKLRDEFGKDAEEMIQQFKDRVREEAFKASPKIAGGIDPNLPRWDSLYDDLAKTWLPQARATVARLTAPPR